MNADEARRWLVRFSLCITGGLFLFLLLAPALGYPLEYSQAIRLIEIVIPTFVGYLGAATRYLVSKRPAGGFRRGDATKQISGVVVRGTCWLFVVLAAGVLLAFGLTNRSGAAPGAGMDVDLLAGLFATLLALVTATTGILIAHLFAGGD